MRSGGQQVFEPQAPFGDRPGLVRADIRDPADVLDGDRTPDQGLTLRHAIHADAEEEGEDDRELLRDRRRGERDRADEGVEPAVSLVERTAARARQTTRAATTRIFTSLPIAACSGVTSCVPWIADRTIRRRPSHRRCRRCGRGPRRSRAGSRRTPSVLPPPAGRLRLEADRRAVVSGRGRPLPWARIRRPGGPSHRPPARRPKRLPGRDHRQVARDEIDGRDRHDGIVPDDICGRGEARLETCGRRLGSTMKVNIHPEEGKDGRE